MTSIRSITLVLVPAVSMACSNRAPQERAAPATNPAVAATEPEIRAPSLAGQWSVRSSPAPDRPFRLALSVDSVVDGIVHGRVTAYFLGDMGSDPNSFRPFAGTLADSSLTIDVLNRGLGDTAISLAGIVRGDSVALSRFRLAGANLTRDDVSWLLVRSTR